MATVKQFDFSDAPNPALAAQIASLNSKDILALYATYMGITGVSNFTQYFARQGYPSKCAAAVRLAKHPGIEANPAFRDSLAKYTHDANERNAGRSQGKPIDQYQHVSNGQKQQPSAQDQNRDRLRELKEIMTEIEGKQITHSEGGSEPDGVQPLQIEDMGEGMQELQDIVDDLGKESKGNSDKDGEGKSDKKGKGEKEPQPEETDPLRKAIKEVVYEVLEYEELLNDEEEQQQQVQGVDEEAVNKLIDAKLKGQTKITKIKVEYVPKEGEDKPEPIDLGTQHKMFNTLVELCKVRDYLGYVFSYMLPGPAGAGKTTACMHLAKAFRLPFYHDGAVADEFKLLGFRTISGSFHETPFYKAYKTGGVYLLDEMDASAAQALVALNTAIENGHCTFGNGETVERHKDCIILAAANTYGTGATHEYVGRTKLDGATIDRFLTLPWEYDEDFERRLAGNDNWVSKVIAIRDAVKSLGIKHIVSPRASIRGAALLAAGMPETLVMSIAVWKGLTKDQITSIRNAARIS